MDDPSGITGDVFEQLGQAGKGGQQTVLDEAKKIPAAVVGQLFGSSSSPEAQDPKELAGKQELEEKKQKEKAQSEAEVQQILIQLEEEMQKNREQRVQGEEAYHNQEITKAVPQPEIEEKATGNLPQPLEVQKSRAEKSAALRGE